MMTAQQKHLVATKHMNRDLVSSGANKTIANIISDDFCFKSKKKGIVEKIDEKNEIAILSYSDGTKDFIDLSEKMVKNGG